MSYKIVLVHVDDSARVQERILIASRIAIQEQAHLVGVGSTGVSEIIYQTTAADIGNGYISAYIDTLRQRAEDGLRTFGELTRRLGVPSTESRLIDEETAAGVSLEGRYADLIVLGQSDPEAPSGIVGEDFPEFVALHSGSPVLVIPRTGEFSNFPQKAVVAWDGGIEARRAVHDALPLLERTALVEIAVFNAPERPDVHGQQPGADIALYLTRHGIAVEVRDAVVPHNDIGTALMTHLADVGADLLVMGCYGHSRLHEILLGGVSRTLLSAAKVPVLMSH
ncbi:MAG: universal stress protein [Herminiimonas sp.]|nr:universal stress protein [Herminiimonas sp.]